MGDRLQRQVPAVGEPDRDRARDLDHPSGARRLPPVLTPVLGVLLAVMVLLDLWRASAGPRVRPWQWAVGLATLVVLWCWLKAYGMARPAFLTTFFLAASLLPTVVDHSRRLESDGIHYYSYLRSALFDRDLDLANDYTLLGWEPQINPLPIGAPLLWSPLVVLVHVGREAARLFGADAPTGVEPAYQAAVSLATLGYGAAGLLLLPAALRRWVMPAAAFWATVLSWLGSPLRFYLSVLPGLAHGAEFFAAVLVLRSYLALRDRPDRRRALLAGAACGLAFLVRSQDGLLLALPGLDLASRLFAGSDRRRALPALAALLFAFVLVALPQLVVWQLMYGSPVLVPHQKLHGAHFFLENPQLAGTLVAPQGGLFLSHPILLLAALGLLALAVRDRRYVAAALPVLLLAWYVNARVFDWYHVRRFTGVVPLLAPGLAFAIVPLARSLPAMALLAFVALRFDLAVDALRRVPGDPAPLRAVWAEMADGLATESYRVLHAGSPRLAVGLLGTYTGEPVLQEDVSRIDLAGSPSVLRLPLRARHLSGVEVEDGAAGRWVVGRETRLFLPLARPEGVVVTVRARPMETGEAQGMDLLWNDEPVGRVVLSPAWGDYRFSVPADRVRAGTNALVLRFDRAPIFHRVRGRGPKEPRSAILAAITLHRQR